jgi:hypothetical protein
MRNRRLELMIVTPVVALVTSFFCATYFLSPNEGNAFNVVGDHPEREPTGRGLEFVLLNGKLAIAQDDLDWYVWSTHMMKLRPTRELKIPLTAPGSRETGHRFSVRIDGKFCYEGVFVQSNSNARRSEIWIGHPPTTAPNEFGQVLKIIKGENESDPRDNPLIRDALSAKGLLK